MGMAGAVRTVAGAAVPGLTDAFGRALGNVFNPQDQQQGRRTPTLDVTQANQARDSNNNFAADRSRRQMILENQMNEERAAANEARRRSGAEFDSGVLNAGANSTTARSMATSAANALNDQYMTAGDRLNTAANNSQRAANDAMATLATIFR